MNLITALYILASAVILGVVLLMVVATLLVIGIVRK
jgi:hypothetical protein